MPRSIKSQKNCDYSLHNYYLKSIYRQILFNPYLDHVAVSLAESFIEHKK